MKISNIRREIIGDSLILKANCKIRPIGDDILYFKFPIKYQSYVYSDASPFAATLMIPAMYRGENLIIDGSISKKLLEGMNKIMDVMVGWNLGMKKIEIVAETVVEDEGTPDKVATFFSCGIDSFYTYLKHKSDTTDKINHFIFLRGTDIELHNEILWEKTLHNIREVASTEGIELIEIETNAQELVEPFTIPDYTHGGTLAAAALCLRRGLKKAYIPASFNVIEPQKPWGSLPDIDPLWSSEILNFVHDGFESTRVNKVRSQIANSPLALKHLRVCFKNYCGRYNCGKCEKCVRTKINLLAAKCLDRCETFKNDLEPGFVEEAVANCGHADWLHGENLRELKAAGIAPEIQDAISRGLARRKIENKQRFQDVAWKKFVYIDHLYLRGVLFRFWVRNFRDRFRNSFCKEVCDN